MCQRTIVYRLIVTPGRASSKLSAGHRTAFAYRGSSHSRCSDAAHQGYAGDPSDMPLRSNILGRAPRLLLGVRASALP